MTCRRHEPETGEGREGGRDGILHRLDEHVAQWCDGAVARVFNGDVRVVL